MAKAKEITGIDCAADALLWATEVLRVRLGEAIDARDAALDFSDRKCRCKCGLFSAAF
jgi:hypothetical protein